MPKGPRSETYKRFLEGTLGAPPSELEQKVSQRKRRDLDALTLGAAPMQSPPAVGGGGNLAAGEFTPSGQGFSPDELTDMVTRAGWTGQDVPLMVATIMRESGGDPGARNTKGEFSRGLLQVNTAPGGNTQYAGRNLNDPATNLGTGYEMFQRSGYQPWYGYSTNLAPRIAQMQKYIGEAWAAAARRGLVSDRSTAVTFNPGGKYGPQTLRLG